MGANPIPTAPVSNAGTAKRSLARTGAVDREGSLTRDAEPELLVENAQEIFGTFERAGGEIGVNHQLGHGTVADVKIVGRIDVDALLQQSRNPGIAGHFGERF